MTVETPLQKLRDAIDAIDNKIVDLLHERAEVVSQVRGVKGKLPVYIRPGREADMLRALTQRPVGQIPRGLIHRLWREIIGGFTLIEDATKVAVVVPLDEPGQWDLARDHFGGLTPMTEMKTAELAIKAVVDKTHQVAIAPYPTPNETWWHALVHKNAPHVFYRLPFDGVTGNARTHKRDAIEIGYVKPEQTHADRTVVIIEGRGDMAGFTQKPLLQIVAGGFAWLEFDGFMLEWAALDEYAAREGLRARVAGAYPVPLKG